MGTRAMADRKQNETSPGQPEEEEQGGQLVKVLGAGAVAGGLASVGGLAYVYQDEIRSGLTYFSTVVDDWGAWGYVAYMGVYTGLEVLALPAIPLTMTAGVLFGTIPGTAMVSVCATSA